MSANLQNVDLAYADRQRDVLDLVAMIGREVRRHGTEAVQAGMAWDHVGDLGSLRATLVSALAQLAGQDPGAIEARLADRHGKEAPDAARPSD